MLRADDGPWRQVEVLQKSLVQLEDGLTCTKERPTSVPATREQYSCAPFHPLQVGKAGGKLEGNLKGTGLSAEGPYGRLRVCSSASCPVRGRELGKRTTLLSERKTALIATQSQSRISRGKCGQAGGRRMRWWFKALIFSVIFSVIWFGIVVAVGYVHTDVFLAGQITPAQDQAISEKYGEFGGAGLVVVWVICFLVLWSRSGRNP